MNKPHAIFFNPPIESYYIGHQFSEIYKDGIFTEFMPKEKKGTVCVDIGGNIGTTAYYFSRFFETVHVVEPAIENFELLTQMIEYNNLKNVHAHKLAIHLEEGILPLYKNRNRTMYSLHGAVHDNTQEPDNVRVLPLDKFFEENNIDHVDLLKVDIEGSEVEVFSSIGFNNVADKIDTIITERHAWSGRAPEQLDEALKIAGFEVAGIPSSADIVVAKRK